MVSRQEGTLFTRKRDTAIYGEEFHNSSKKSKQEQSQSLLHNGRPISENVRSVTFDFDLHLHTPLTSDSENSTKPNKGYSRTSEDCRYHKDSMIIGGPKMSLDLELNLSPSCSPSKTTKIDESTHHDGTVSSKSKNLTYPSNRSPSWLAFQVVNDDDVDRKEQEMVTTVSVCMKCHMLIMLCKLTPVCPNCKFMHPHDHSSTKQFKTIKFA